MKDLPKSTLGVDIDNDFETEYVVIPGKEKVLAKLKKLALSADNIYLAPDPDREGEAIAWHLAEELGDGNKGKKKKKKKEGDEPDRIRRVTFNEITKRAVQEAFEHPRDIDQNLVDAQQARRVLDRLVGYQVSPLLWDKVRRGLSAGRVQTVALRLIVEREREIKAFQKVEYWTIDAHLAGPKPPAFDARFVGKGEEKVEVNNGEDAEKIRAALEKADWLVRTVDRKERRRNATPPFTTSKLQQDSSRKLRFSVKRTMMIAQRLYEGVELGEEGSVGLITYMRTDSTRVSNEALAEVREYITAQYGKDYLPESAERLQREEGGAGGARSHPSHFGDAPSRPDQAISERRRVQGLQADLAALRGFADHARRLRPDHRGHRRQVRRRDFLVPRDRFGAQVRRLPESLRRSRRMARTRKTRSSSTSCRRSSRDRSSRCGN